MESLCLAHNSLRLEWCAYICLISGMLWGTCLWWHTIKMFPFLQGHAGESVLKSVGHTDRQCTHVCGAYRHELYSCLWSIPKGSVLVSVGHIDRNFSCLWGTPKCCSRACGAYWQEVFSCLRAYRQEVFSCLWGIPKRSDLVSVWHTDRKCSHVWGEYRQEVFSCLWGIPTAMF
jgi:hypothetical protein